MSPVSAAVLLDTCAVIWLANGDAMRKQAVDAIVEAGLQGGILVSPITAWEIGLLSRRGGRAAGLLQFLPDPKTWFARMMAGPGIRSAPFTAEIAIDASHLPGTLHGDPADRLIAATARHLGLSIVTRDTRLLSYSRQGHVAAVRC
jgi:PIN domain nuclease of toxin-antitoxin system